jgi:hypothetical protein
MPAKGSTSTKRTKPLRSDRGVKLCAPTAAKSFFRVVSAGTVERTSAGVPVESIEAAREQGFDPTKVDTVIGRARRETDEIFDRMVAWAKTQPHAAKRREQTMNALCDRRLQELRDEDRALGTYDKNESLLRLYVRPQIGHVDVADWNAAHSQQVIRAARTTCGAERIHDLGSVLRSLVTLAHRKPAWLPRDEDPTEDVDFHLAATTQGVAVIYVPVSERPSIQQVESLAIAMGERSCQTMIYLAGHPKLRPFNTVGASEDNKLSRGHCGTAIATGMQREEDALATLHVSKEPLNHELSRSVIVRHLNRLSGITACLRSHQVFEHLFQGSIRLRCDYRRESGAVTRTEFRDAQDHTTLVQCAGVRREWGRGVQKDLGDVKSTSPTAAPRIRCDQVTGAARGPTQLTVPLWDSPRNVPITSQKPSGLMSSITAITERTVKQSRYCKERVTSAGAS